MSQTPSALMTAEELRPLVGSPGVKILDASYNLPPFSKGIAGAVDFDIDDIADPQAPLAHTVPSAELFGEKAGRLGIGNKDMVVVYDRAGISMAASRAWWMFRLFGHDNVRILDGGLPAWVEAGYSLAEKAQPVPASFSARFRPELLKEAGDIKENIGAKKFAVLDARDPRRYSGEAPEPRPGMAAGHIPQSLNVPFMALVGQDGKLKPAAELEKIFKSSSVDVKAPVACSCGSGVTACVVALGLFELGNRNAAVYDGSWAEWGSDPSLPKKKAGGLL